jgi:hypothetical protein
MGVLGCHFGILSAGEADFPVVAQVRMFEYHELFE